MPDPRTDQIAASPTLRFLTLRLDARCYALRSGDVVEVIRVPPMTRVPQSPQALLGIANLRGRVLPITSLRVLLGMPADGAVRSTTRAIVLDVGAPVAIVVDAVDALVTVASDRIDTRQTELAAEPGERLDGTFDTGDVECPARILDIKSLLDAAFAQRAQTGRGVVHGRGAKVIERASANLEAVDMLVTFDVAGQEFALDIAAVREVLPAPPVRTTVPRAEALILGMTSLRGALLPLLSLRGLLGFPAAPASGLREKVIVVSVAGAQVGLVADRARAIVAAEPGLVDPVPAVLSSRMGGESRIRAIYRGEGGRRLISILAPEHLFREEVMQRLNAQRTGKDMSTPSAVESEEKTFDVLVFRLGEDEFGLPIETVEEVAQVPAQITRVPKTPKFLEGVINLRGTVLPIIDQRRRFDMSSSAQSPRRRLVVVRTHQHRAGLIVDAVPDVLRISEASIEAAPRLTEGIARLVLGVINLHQSNRIVLLLDSSELLTRAERGILDKFQTEIVPANV